MQRLGALRSCCGALRSCWRALGSRWGALRRSGALVLGLRSQVLGWLWGVFGLSLECLKGVLGTLWVSLEGFMGSTGGLWGMGPAIQKFQPFCNFTAPAQETY